MIFRYTATNMTVCWGTERQDERLDKFLGEGSLVFMGKIGAKFTASDSPAVDYITWIRQLIGFLFSMSSFSVFTTI